MIWWICSCWWFNSTNSVYCITNKSYRWCTTCVSRSNRSNIRSRYCLVTGKRWWCRTSNGWWSYIHGSYNCLRTDSSITARICCTVSSCSCLSTTNSVHCITNKSYRWCTTGVSSSNRCNVRSRYCLVTGKRWWCRTSNGWWSYIHGSYNCLRTDSSVTARICCTVSSRSCLSTTNSVHCITNKSYSWCTTCVSSSYRSWIRSRYCLVTGKRWWCRTSNGWWSYIHSSYNCLRTCSSITARISSTISSCSCLSTTNSVHCITNKSYRWCTTCVSRSNRCNVRSRYCLVTGKRWWCRTSNGWWSYIHSPYNSLSTDSSITARICCTISSCSCFCTTNSVHCITNKSYRWCTAGVSSSYRCNVRSRYCLVTGKRWWCRTSDRWWSYIYSSCNKLTACCRVPASINSTISSCSCFCTTNSVHCITNKSYRWCTTCVSSSNRCNVRSRYCLVTGKRWWCRTSNGWWSYIHGSYNCLRTDSSVTARICCTVNSCSCLSTTNSVHCITNKSYSWCTTCVSSSNRSWIRSRYCLVTGKRWWCRTSNGWCGYIHGSYKYVHTQNRHTTRIRRTEISSRDLSTTNSVHC